MHSGLLETEYETATAQRKRHRIKRSLTPVPSTVCCCTYAADRKPDRKLRVLLGCQNRANGGKRPPGPLNMVQSLNTAAARYQRAVYHALKSATVAQLAAVQVLLNNVDLDTRPSALRLSVPILCSTG